MKIAEIETRLKSRLNFDGMIEIAYVVGDADANCKDVISLCEHQDQQVAFRASWTLDFIAAVHTEIFLNDLSVFLKLYPTIKNLSVQRSFTKIMMILTEGKFMRTQNLKPIIFDDCFTATFDWLLDPQTPLAVQCNAMDVVFQLSPYHDWVIDELKVILQQKLISGSPALISRSKKILKCINSK